MVHRKRLARHLGFAVFLLACAMTVLTIPANAAAGGSQGGQNPRPTLSFSSTSVSVGDTYVVTGTGFPPDTWVGVLADFSDVPQWGLGSSFTDGAGNLSASFVATSSGHVRHIAKMWQSNGRLGKEAQAILRIDPALQVA